MVFIIKNSFDAKDLKEPIRKDVEIVDYFYGGE